MTLKIEIELSHLELTQTASHRAAGDAFGLSQSTIAGAIQLQCPLVLLATAEQFGAFIALRNAYGGVNRIMTLKPKLIANPLKAKIDVTQYRLAA